MERQGGGAIVNLASTSGIRWTGAAQVGYASSKAGVIQFSRVTAVQYAKKGIRVNTVIPGQLHTPMVEVRLAKQRTGGDVEKLLESRVKRIPLGFMGDGRDTANAALFLASDEARFVTGTEIVVDGGMSVALRLKTRRHNGDRASLKPPNWRKTAASDCRTSRFRGRA